MGINNRARRKRGGGPWGASPELGPAEAAGLLIEAAVQAFRRGDRPRGDEAARLLSEIPQAGGLLLHNLQEAVLGAWERGWQPADLARTATRRLSPIHERLVVDAIAAQMRGYPPARVDRRWDEQVRGLGATVWWQGDDGYLDQWAGRAALQRQPAVVAALQLLMLLLMLPRIPVLWPLPGAARHDAAPGPAADARVLHKVRALLAKAESTEFPEEAEALTAKAQELIARHSIDSALLAATASTASAASSEEPGGLRVGLDAPYEAEKMALLKEVADANRCRVVWASRLGFATVFGFDTDVVAVELLFTSLLVQATAAMTRAGSKRRPGGGSRTRSFRQSFLSAYAFRIGQRLHGVAEEATRQTAGGNGNLLPVLAARVEKVEARVAAHYPELSFRTLSGGHDSEGWASGTAAADQAIITHARTSVAAPKA